MGTKRALIVVVIIYAAAMSAVSISKYQQFGYNGVDLAIFNQVLWGSVNNIGAHSSVLMKSSIQGHSYFGDHFAPILFLLAPIYWLWQDPRWLLIIQSVVLGLTAIPVYLIARFVLEEITNYEFQITNKLKSTKPKIQNTQGIYSLAFAVIWLLNPFLHNINLFEFHLLPFALLFFLWAVYFYITRHSGERHSSASKISMNRPYIFILFLALALMVREDAALVVVMFGVVVAVDWWRGRPTRTCNFDSHWYLATVPLTFGIVWFVAAQRIIGYYSPSGVYQFFTYYSWLGSGFDEIAANLIGHPVAALKHVLTFSNINFLVGIFLPFLFFPLIKPKWTLLSLPVIAAAILSLKGSVWLQTHLITLALPGIAAATAYAYAVFVRKLENRKLNPIIVPIMLLIVSGMSYWVLGPGFARQASAEYKQEAWNVLSQIPSDASVAATYRYQSQLSSREKLYDMRYIWLGRQQYTNTGYGYEPPDYIVIDPEDILSYYIQFPSLAWTRYSHKQGAERLRSLIAEGKYGLRTVRGNMIIMEKNSVGTNGRALDELEKLLENASVTTSRCTGGMEVLKDRSTGIVIDSCDVRVKQFN